ncbi:MAG: hypothetical protein HKN82_03180 [Akkermansiaceae bacterium]|nr:hypothetical protein [Akkermansiaceae bacterium]NNM28550.1 hypothetical protein [Akkermansiaceae bacterium]
MLRPALFLGALPVFLVSCTVYLRDAIDGSPWNRGYDSTYAGARAEGLPHDQAHRRALLHGQESHHTIWDRRKAGEKADRKRRKFFGDDDDDDDIKVRWD